MAFTRGLQGVAVCLLFGTSGPPKSIALNMLQIPMTILRSSNCSSTPTKDLLPRPTVLINASGLPRETAESRLSGYGSKANIGYSKIGGVLTRECYFNARVA